MNRKEIWDFCNTREKIIDRKMNRSYFLLSILAVVSLLFHFDVLRRIQPKPQPDIRAVVRVSGTTPYGVAGGSGVIVAPRRILTNAHVVEDMLSIRIEYTGKNGVEIYDGKVLRIDKDKDLALIETAQTFTNQTIIGLDNIEIGHELWIVGASAGLSAQNMTKGTLTSKGINVPEHATWWQSSASVTNGNSGGAVFDADTGCLIGITVATCYVGSPSPFLPPSPAPNVSFFIPAYQIRAFLDDDTPNSPPPVGPSQGTPDVTTEGK